MPYNRSELMASCRILKMTKDLVEVSLNSARDANEAQVAMKLKDLARQLDDLIYELDDRLKVQP